MEAPIRLTYQDDLNNVPSTEVARTSYAVVDTIQHARPMAQVVALAVLFRALCETYRVDPRDVFTVVGNMLASKEAEARPEFDALVLYIQHELAA